MSVRPLERRVLAIGTAIVLHAVVLSFAAAAQVLVSASEWVVPALPRRPLLLAAVALVMAHVSLGAIWWGRSRWPSYAKTLVAVLATAVLWALLIGVLEATLAEAAAAGWAASLSSQMLLVGLGTVVLELAQAPPGAAIDSRFTILFLLLWTAVVAVLLGAGRTVAEACGWKLADVLNWEWLYQLQVLGIANAVLALGLLASIRLRRDWTVRLLVAVFTLLLVSLIGPAAMTLLFSGRVGASFADVAWVLLTEGLLLLSALAPWQAAQQAPA